MPPQNNVPPPTTPNLVARRSEKLWLPVWHERDGTPITNSAGQIPLKPIYHPFAVNVWEFEVFKIGYTSTQNSIELNAINSIAWQGYGQYQAWISEIHSEGQDAYGYPPENGENLRYVVRCVDRWKGWKCQHPDVGWDYLNAGELNRFFSANGGEYIGKLSDGGDDAGVGGALRINLETINREINFFSTLGV